MEFLKDNCPVQNEIIKNSDLINDLKNKDLKTLLHENKNLILFPDANSRNLNEESYIFEQRRNELWTGNIVGFFSYEKKSKKVKREEFVIHSRFSGKDKLENDFFLIYMLNKVMHYNITSQKLSFIKDNHSFFDIYMYLFPNQLEKANKQGLYKEYVTKHYNDMNVKGILDVKNFMKKNIPFTGKISYKTREFSYDNNITQLIRHTIEFIKQKSPSLLSANHNIIDSVRKIIQVTPSYKKENRHRIIAQNMKNKLNKAFFSEYITLQELCLKILRYEKINYDKKESVDKISGVIVDIAWLWEKYISIITSSKKGPEGVPTNEKFNEKNWYNFNYKENPLHLFINKKVERYPDFTYGNIPIDTKYKLQIDKRNDYNQIITYMYMTQSRVGIFLKPSFSEQKEKEDRYKSLGRLVGYGGEIFEYNFNVPKDTDYEGFVDNMLKEEKKLREFDFSSILG